MASSFRDFLAVLEARGELRRVADPIDLRHVSALTAASPQALWFEQVAGYEMGVVSGVLGSRERMGALLDCDHRDIGKVFLKRLQQQRPPVMVDRKDAPVKEVILTGDQIDLTSLPVPLVSQLDGGPYITSAIGIARDPEYGRNVGCYRFMVRTERETGIDLVGASDLKLFYDRAFRQGKPLQLAIAIGVHPAVLMGAAHMAPAGKDEFELAGGLLGEPVQLVKCETVDLEVPANAEIVIEGELLPIGWTEDEGRFGDFTGFVGPIKYNPVFRVTAITKRRDAVFYALHMPDEVDYLIAPPLEGSGWQALATAGIDARAVYAPASAGCNLHLYASIRKRPGEGKNALLALLSLKRVKLAVVTDDDIDIFDPVSLERAMAYRVQPHRDVVMLDGARGSHLDPSVQIQVTKGALAPLTGKWGIDATIPEGTKREEYDAVVYPFAEMVAGSAPQEDGALVPSQSKPGATALADRIAAFLATPRHFYDVLAEFSSHHQRDIVRAWAVLRSAGKLGREEASGRYLLKN